MGFNEHVEQPDGLTPPQPASINLLCHRPCWKTRSNWWSGLGEGAATRSQTSILGLASCGETNVGAGRFWRRGFQPCPSPPLPPPTLECELLPLVFSQALALPFRRKCQVLLVSPSPPPFLPRPPPLPNRWSRLTTRRPARRGREENEMDPKGFPPKNNEGRMHDGLDSVQ